MAKWARFCGNCQMTGQCVIEERAAELLMLMMGTAAIQPFPEHSALGTFRVLSGIGKACQLYQYSWEHDHSAKLQGFYALVACAEEPKDAE